MNSRHVFCLLLKKTTYHYTLHIYSLVHSRTYALPMLLQLDFFWRSILNLTLRHNNFKDICTTLGRWRKVDIMINQEGRQGLRKNLGWRRRSQREWNINCESERNEASWFPISKNCYIFTMKIELYVLCSHTPSTTFIETVSYLLLFIPHWWDSYI